MPENTTQGAVHRATRKDPSYNELFKLLFKHKSIMASLLRGIGTFIGIPELWIQAMILDTLQPFPTEYLSKDLKKKLRKLLGDSAWIVEIRGEYLGMTDGITRYFAFVHEFQSTVDLTMPMRMDIYVSLIQIDLWRAGLTPRGEATLVISLLTHVGGAFSAGEREGQSPSL